MMPCTDDYCMVCKVERATVHVTQFITLVPSILRADYCQGCAEVLGLSLKTVGETDLLEKIEAKRAEEISQRHHG